MIFWSELVHWMLWWLRDVHAGMWAGAVAGSHMHLVLVGSRRPAAVIGFNLTARFLHSTNCPLYGTVKGVPVGVSARSRFIVW